VGAAGASDPASPSAAVLDSQSIKSAEKGAYDNKVGYDAGKGRKIRARGDNGELAMRVVVHPAACGVFRFAASRRFLVPCQSIM
jgi:hypothetical protein